MNEGVNKTSSSDSRGSPACVGCGLVAMLTPGDIQVSPFFPGCGRAIKVGRCRKGRLYTLLAREDGEKTGLPFLGSRFLFFFLRILSHWDDLDQCITQGLQSSALLCGLRELTLEDLTESQVCLR